MKISIFWFRRDLRLNDNMALNHALKSQANIMPVFIFDTNIIKNLPANDARINFIYYHLSMINKQLQEKKASIKILYGDPFSIWKNLIQEFDIDSVFFNHDYEPEAIQRDILIKNLLEYHHVKLFTFKDQVIFEKNEILKSNHKPYTIFTPYRNRWLSQLFQTKLLNDEKIKWDNFYRFSFEFPSLEQLGFKKHNLKFKPFNLENITDYDKTRDYPFLEQTTRLGPYLRFGIISIRSLVNNFSSVNEIFINELIWREFFMQIVYHFPEVVRENFKPKYNSVQWMNQPDDYNKWCEGKTGYPLVDAGMRQLNQTGYMHNRVRMITAGFLCKHLLIDWRWGEQYFAEKLLDYEQSSNNGNWQWAAGTGCDAAPYFRIFNPVAQQKKFDPEFKYIKKWIPEFNTPEYPPPMIDHKYARERALSIYKSSLKNDFS